MSYEKTTRANEDFTVNNVDNAVMHIKKKGGISNGQSNEQRKHCVTSVFHPG